MKFWGLMIRKFFVEDRFWGLLVDLGFVRLERFFLLVVFLWSMFYGFVWMGRNFRESEFFRVFFYVVKVFLG